MIGAVDSAVADVLCVGVKTNPAVDVKFDAPTRDWASKQGTSSTVNCFLYDIREDPSRASLDGRAVFDGSGPDRRRVGVVPPTRYMRLSYLLTAWAREARDEHDVLGQVLMVLLSTPVLPDAAVSQRVLVEGLRATTTVARMANERQTADLWSAVGGNLKPAVDLQVLVPVAATPVVEDMTVVQYSPILEIGAKSETSSVTEVVGLQGIEEPEQRGIGIRRAVSRERWPQ